ncbi:MAG: hypothetical protein V7K14_01865, partial [Nostoc sp.]|uniref:hypothetical protein n=1 Tax=Nostoc sp. TaxID=1180 RepID=UPI002FFC0375
WFLRHALYSTIRCDPLYPLIFLPIPYLLSGYVYLTDKKCRDYLINRNFSEDDNVLGWDYID